MRPLIIHGNCLTELPKLAEGSVHCCVTSPPYFGLRDYKIPATDWPAVEFVPMAGLPPVSVPAVRCVHGLESDPLSYVAHEVLIFREVTRVLRTDGTLWLNLGDSYASNGGHTDTACNDRRGAYNLRNRPEHDKRDFRIRGKPKDLIGIPWRVAFALQADGWTLRMDNIWHKPNPMPESVTDRPTKAHEYVFLFSKSERYFYDAEAIKEQVTGDAQRRKANGKNSRMGVVRAYGKEDSKPNPSKWEFRGVAPKSAPVGSGIKANESFHSVVNDLVSSRNKRSVWSVGTAPFRGAHFATFPPDLIRPCILAGTSARGCCAKCGSSWERITEQEDTGIKASGNKEKRWGQNHVTQRDLGEGEVERHSSIPWNYQVTKTTGWRPTCDCACEQVSPCTVLDPFLGSGTVAQVALENARHCIGIDLSDEYHKLIEQRTNVTPGLPLA